MRRPPDGSTPLLSAGYVYSHPSEHQTGSHVSGSPGTDGERAQKPSQLGDGPSHQ